MPQEKIVIHGARPIRLVSFAHLARMENVPTYSDQTK